MALNKSHWPLFTIALIALALVFRFFPHPVGFSPLMAVALVLGRRYGLQIATAILFVLLVSTDWYLGFYGTMWANYLAFALAAGFGAWGLQRITTFKVVGITLSSSLLFFTISNFAVWLEGWLYPRTMDGLVACFVAALPFLQNSVGGDLLFSLSLFGILSVLEKRVDQSQVVGARN